MQKTKENTNPIVARILQITFLLCGIILILFGLLLLLVTFFGGIISVLLAVLCFRLSKKYSRIAKLNKSDSTNKTIISSTPLVEPFVEPTSNKEEKPNDVSNIAHPNHTANDVSFVSAIEDNNNLAESQKEETIQEEVIQETPKKAHNYTPCLTKVLDGNLLSYTREEVDVALANLDNVELYCPVSFEHEPTNEYDPNAVLIKNLSNDEKIGYLYRGKLQKWVLDYINKDYPVYGYVDSVSDNTCTIRIGFYKPFDLFEQLSSSLTKTTKKDWSDCSRQDNLSCVSEGDIFDVEFDFESETYLVTDDCGNELGELSKAISSKIKSRTEKYDHAVVCQSLEYDDSLKIKCKVLILFQPK